MTSAGPVDVEPGGEPMPAAVTGVTRPARRLSGGADPVSAPTVAEDAEVRFGPGVPAVIATLPTAAGSVGAGARAGRRRRVRAFAVTVMTALLAAVLWWWLHRTEPLEVSAVTPVASDGVLGCGETADLQVTVRTNGEEGEIEYRWLRSDGTQSPVLVEKLADGQRSATLVLHWKVVGAGMFHGQANAVISKPNPLTATASFDYSCR